MKDFFKKLYSKVLEFWYFCVCNRCHKSLVTGGFQVDFRNYDIRIKSLSGNFSMKVRSGEYAFGYLYAALGKGNTENIHGYALFVYTIASCICQDEKFAEDVLKSIEDYAKRAEEKPSEELDDLDDETILMALQKDIEYSELPRSQRRKIDREFKKTLKKIEKDEQK